MGMACLDLQLLTTTSIEALFAGKEFLREPAFKRIGMLPDVTAPT